MSVFRRSSAMGNVQVDRDVLWLIFSINANMLTDKDALKTTRLCSQVCRTWRNAILDTPSLWARLIDLDALDQGADDWRNEVLRRSANSLLWIKSTKRICNSFSWVKDIDGHRLQVHVTGLQRFFFSVLDTHWNRIEKLIVSIEVGRAGPRSWRAIYLPAPCLRVCELEFHGIETTSVPPTAPLFANYAPLLNRFYAKDMKFDLSAPWIPHIRSIQIGPPFTLSETLKLLKRTSLLENLRVEEVKMDTTNDLHPIRLPKLNEMKFVTHFNACLILLGSILCMSSCPPRMSVYASASHSQNFNATAFQSMSGFLTSYFGVYAPTAITLDISQESFCFKSKTTEDDSALSMTILIPPQDRQNISDRLLRTFTIPTFNTVKELEVKKLVSSPAMFSLFLFSLPSVQVLHVEDKALWTLLEIQKNTVQIFLPLLHTVRLSRPDSVAWDKLLFFLRARTKAGHPISTLDLIEYTKTLAPRDMSSIKFLEELTGLRVLYSRRDVEHNFEHVCGSGNSTRL